MYDIEAAIRGILEPVWHKLSQPKFYPDLNESDFFIVDSYPHSDPFDADVLIVGINDDILSIDMAHVGHHKYSLSDPSSIAKSRNKLKEMLA